MKVEVKENQIILKEVYNSITLETKEGKQLHICMRDYGFEMKIDLLRAQLAAAKSALLTRRKMMNAATRAYNRVFVTVTKLEERYANHMAKVK